MHRDEDVRASCFAALDVLQAKCGADIPYSELVGGFNFRGSRIPFLNKAYGIYRARAQQGDAALSLNSSFVQSRYQDREVSDGILYRYQDGPIDNHFNRWLRNAHALRVPLVYFIGSRRGWYRPEYPAYVERDSPSERRVLLTCTICRLKDARLLDAAHIIGDAEERGEPTVSNGLSLCSIHHRAFDHDLVGVSPDYGVHVSRRLLDDDDGPMLEVLKGFQGASIHVPRRTSWRPDRESLAERFERFEKTH